MLDSLPETDRLFYDELSAPCHTHAQQLTGSPATGQSKSAAIISPAPAGPDEPPFSEPNPQDDCEAIPTSVIIEHICSGNIAGGEYREDDGVLSLAPAEADEYGECDSDSESDGNSSESENHDTSDGDWEPTVQAAAAASNNQTSTGSEFDGSVHPIHESRTTRVRKLVNLESRFRFWQEN